MDRCYEKRKLVCFFRVNERSEVGGFRLFVGMVFFFGFRRSKLGMVIRKFRGNVGWGEKWILGDI